MLLLGLGLTLLPTPGVERFIPRAHAQRFGGNSGGPGTPENIEGFTVAGKGMRSARPNLLEIDLEVMATSELTADAIVKYQGARRKIEEAFAALKLPNVTVEPRGLMVDKKGTSNPYYFRFGEPNTRTKTEVQLSRKLVVKGANIRSMDEDALLQLTAKLLDVAQDAGARVGASNDNESYYWFYSSPPRHEGLVRFVLDDFEKLEEEAYAQAIADARARAERLARLAQVELGRVVAVREIEVPGEVRDEEGGDDEEHGQGKDKDKEKPHRRLVAAKFQEVPIRVELLVRFEVHGRSDGKARAGE